MEHYIWSTENPHSSNEQTMNDFIENHIESIFTSKFEVFVDGSYAEVDIINGNRFALHASGNGDFLNHKIRFEKL